MSRTYRKTDYNPMSKDKKADRKVWQRKFRKQTKQYLHEHVGDDEDYVEEKLPQFTRTGGWLTW